MVWVKKKALQARAKMQNAPELCYAQAAHMGNWISVVLLHPEWDDTSRCKMRSDLEKVVFEAYDLQDKIELTQIF